MPTKDPQRAHEIAKLAAAKRWECDPVGTARLVDRVVRRAGSLSAEQRRTIITAFTVTPVHDG